MLKISRLENPFQEVVFLLTITLSLTIGVGGLFYLSLSPETLLSVAGDQGSKLIASGFRSFGYTYFFIMIFLLHMGHLALATAYSAKDLLRNLPIYIKSFVIYFTVLLLISSFSTVLQAYNGWPVSALMEYGHGGWFGSVLGGFLFKSFGLFGALILLFIITSVLGISAGYMEIVHSFYVMKDILQEIVDKVRTHGPVLIKELSDRVTDFMEQKPDFATTGGSTTMTAPVLRRQNMHRSMSPSYSGRFTTDHFHTPERLKEKNLELKEETPAVESTENVVEQRPVVAARVKKAEAVVKPVAEKKKKQEPVQVQQEEAPEETVEAEAKQDNLEVKAWTKRYKKLETQILEKPEKKQMKSDAEIKELCQLIGERLDSFGIKGEVIKAHQGATLTMFEFMPAAGVKLSKIQSLSDDLALVLGAKAIRILTPIPGKTTVGIEVPNKDIHILRFSELVATCMKKKDMELPVPLGVDVYNQAHVNDLTKMPHLLVSGTTGSGKSVFMNSLISGLIFHKSPKELRFLMIDPKMIELSPYNGIPHLLKPVITDVEEAKNLLLWAEKEMDRRYQIFSEMQSKNIISFNQAIKKTSKRAIEGRLNKKVEWKFEEMPYIVIVIDELADLMLTQRNEVERPITRIAQKARAAGIHMVMATQRPSSDIVTGLIKTNFPTRVSFKVSSSIDSRTILDQPGAEKLLGNGDMLFSAQGKAIERLQGSFMTEDEVKKVVRAVSDQGTSATKGKK